MESGSHPVRRKQTTHRGPRLGIWGIADYVWASSLEIINKTTGDQRQTTQTAKWPRYGDKKMG